MKFIVDNRIDVVIISPIKFICYSLVTITDNSYLTPHDTNFNLEYSFLITFLKVNRLALSNASF